jgi:hypothetical protein
MYDTCMLVWAVQTWPRGDVPGLRLTNEDVDLLRGMDYDILTQGLIGLIEYSYHQGIPSFLETQLKKNSEVKRAGPGAISGWVTDRKVFLCAHK